MFGSERFRVDRYCQAAPTDYSDLSPAVIEAFEKARPVSEDPAVLAEVQAEAFLKPIWGRVQRTEWPENMFDAVDGTEVEDRTGKPIWWRGAIRGI